MFGMMEAMLSFLRRQVGLRTDTASATGSLHAKTADVKESLGAAIEALKKPIDFANLISGTFSTTQTEYQTALNISGNGKLVLMTASKASAGPSGSLGIRITIDGVVVSDAISSGVTTTTLFYPSGALLYITDSAKVGWTTATDGPLTLDLDFKESLKIELKIISLGDAASVSWKYNLFG